MNLKKILAVVLSMTLLVSCLVSGMSLNTSATTPDPETEAKTNLETAWAALEYKPVVVHDGFWKKTTNDGVSWGWPGSAASGDNSLILTDGTIIPAYSVEASTEPPTDDETFIVSDKISYKRPTSNVSVVEGTKLYFYVSGEAIDGISAFYCRANEDTSFYTTFTKEMITDNGGETWTKYGCTVESDASLVNQKLGRLQFTYSTQIFGKKVSAVLIQAPITVPQKDSLLELIKAAEAEDLTTYQNNAAKTEFETALAKAKAAYLSNEANAKAEIIAAWKKVENNPEILFGNFHKGNKWPVVEQTGIENGIPYYADPVKDSGFIIGGSVYSTSDEGFLLADYKDVFVYIATSGDVKLTDNAFGFSKEDPEDYGIESENTVKIELSSTNNALIRYSLKNNITYFSSSYENQKIGRLHIKTTTSAITKISYVYGVKPLNLATAFSDVFVDNDTANDLTLAQLINAYTKYDFENDYDAAELIATVNAVCDANPKYAAFKTVAGYANKVQEVVQVNAPQYDKSNAGITVTKVSNTGSAGVPKLDLYTVGEFGTTTFTGKGFSDLGTTGHSTGFVRYSGVLTTFNSNTNGLYLSYYIPSDTVPATTPIKIQVHYRGTLSSGNTNYNTAYLKQITLTERDKWAVLDLNDLKVDGLSTLTALNDILVDVCAEAETNVTMYFSPLAFTNSANYINTDDEKTLTDYAKTYNATVFTEGERYLYEADFIAARDAFNLALADGYKLQGHGLYNKTGDSHIYTEDGTNYYAGYRIFAQYICPLDNEGKPNTNQIIVDGKVYDLNKRCILVAKNESGPVTGELTLDTQNIKTSEATGAALNNYWDVEKINDETAIVRYSILLKKVNQTQAENNYHQARAMIEYSDGTSNVQIYSETKSCGTILEAHNDLCLKDGIQYEWFPAAEQ